ncbi:ATP synthase A chain [Bifidobacterium breve]|nr:ATP synthase A chain [Bifidobacterium breve]
MVGSFGAGLLLANEGAHLPSVNDFLPRRSCSRALRLPSTVLS